MVECIECGKKLGVFEGYCHPTMGKKHLLCSPCFDHVSDSVSKWRDFVTSNSFNVEVSKNYLELNLKKISTISSKIQKVFGNLWSEKEICMKR